MNRLCLALFVGLGAAPALAADYSLTCALGPPGTANFSLYATSNGIPHFNCRAGCSATDPTGAPQQFICQFRIDSSDSYAWKCADDRPAAMTPYSNPQLLFLGGDPCQ